MRIKEYLTYLRYRVTINVLMDLVQHINYPIQLPTNTCIATGLKFQNIFFHSVNRSLNMLDQNTA